MDILMKELVASNVNGYLASHATTTVKNGGTLKSFAVKNENSENVEEVTAIVCNSLIVDNAKIQAKIDMDYNDYAAAWGIAFSDLLAIRNGSEVNIDMNGGIYDGIHYGGPVGEVAQEEVGTVFIKNSNVTINAKTQHDTSTSSTFIATGIYARYLKTQFLNNDYSLNINTSGTAIKSSAIFLQKNSISTKKL